MSSITRKFIAVILAIWLPIFSGNALAVPVQAMGGDEHTMHCDEAMQHALNDIDQDQSAGYQCGTCHCCGYMAVAAIEVIEAQTSSIKFPPFLTRFQSITSYPPDHPPLS